MTIDLYNLSLLAKLMVLYRQILFKLAVAAIVEAILKRISAELVPSLYGVAPRYLTLVTSPWHLAVHANICTGVVRAVGHDHTLFFANFFYICRCSLKTECVGEVLKLIIATTIYERCRRQIGFLPM